MPGENGNGPPSAFSLLIADDLTLVSEGLASLCGGFPGCRVVGSCSDGYEAWRLIERLVPDIAMIDLELPKLIAPELIRRTRESGLVTRIVALSIRADRQTVIETLRSGASGFVLKNSSPRHLEEACRQVLLGGLYLSPTIDLQRTVRPVETAEDHPLHLLSAREHQVFSLLVEGVRAKEIAARLTLSPKTVDTYRASLMRKLDIHDVAGLVKFAIQHRLITMQQV
jgi:DNA-binding NarL/FixJ family response regulator